MPRRKNEERRILGPYHERGGIRYIVVNPSACAEEDRRRSYTFATEADAKSFLDGVLAEWKTLDDTTVNDAIDLYRVFLEQKGNKEGSVKETIRRMNCFFTEPDVLVSELQERRCKRYYSALTSLSADTHRNYLSEAKTFMRWCVDRGWLKESPLEKVVGIGRRKQGKPQLHGDEARKLWGWLLWKAQRKDDTALAVAMLLSMGLRSSEITKRVVRDVDDGGTVLRISKGKTRRSNRAVVIPAPLDALVAQLAKGRDPLAPLFATPEGGHHTKSWLRLALKKRFCDEAGVPYVPPHGLRGTFATLAEEAGEASRAVAATLGHESTETTHAHYTAPEAVTRARQDRALRAIAGGRK